MSRHLKEHKFNEHAGVIRFKACPFLVIEKPVKKLHQPERFRQTGALRDGYRRRGPGFGTKAEMNPVKGRVGLVGRERPVPPSGPEHEGMARAKLKTLFVFPEAQCPGAHQDDFP